MRDVQKQVRCLPESLLQSPSTYCCRTWRQREVVHTRESGRSTLPGSYFLQVFLGISWVHPRAAFDRIVSLCSPWIELSWICPVVEVAEDSGRDAAGADSAENDTPPASSGGENGRLTVWERHELHLGG